MTLRLDKCYTDFKFLAQFLTNTLAGFSRQTEIDFISVVLISEIFRGI